MEVSGATGWQPLQYNSAEFLELLFATAKPGAIFVPINYRLAAPEIAYLLADSGADVRSGPKSLSQLARNALLGEDVCVRLRVTVGGNACDDEEDYETPARVGEPRLLACGWLELTSPCSYTWHDGTAQA